LIGSYGKAYRVFAERDNDFAPEVLLSQKLEEMEAALWTSLRLLKEKATLTEQLAARTRAAANGGAAQAADRIAEQAQLDEQHMHAIQTLLETMPSPMDQATIVVQARNEVAAAAHR
jgi:Mg2+ and Co2+ transporter CorA